MRIFGLCWWTLINSTMYSHFPCQSVKYRWICKCCNLRFDFQRPKPSGMGIVEYCVAPLVYHDSRWQGMALNAENVLRSFLSPLMFPPREHYKVDMVRWLKYCELLFLWPVRLHSTLDWNWTNAFGLLVSYDDVPACFDSVNTAKEKLMFLIDFHVSRTLHRYGCHKKLPICSFIHVYSWTITKTHDSARTFISGNFFRTFRTTSNTFTSILVEVQLLKL